MERQRRSQRRGRAETWLDAVRSLCVKCGRWIQAKRHVTSRGHVVMRQFCPEHGHRAVLVSTDAEWFMRHEPMPALVPGRAQRSIAPGVCSVPVVDLDGITPGSLAERVSWLARVSPGELTVVAPPGRPEAVCEAVSAARSAGFSCVMVEVPAADVDHVLAARLEEAGALVRLDAADAGTAELLERRPDLQVVLVSRLVDAPARGVGYPGLEVAYRSLLERDAVVSWEVIPEGEPSAEWQLELHHPAHGPDGRPSNGPVPLPGPVPATLSEALVHVLDATRGVLRRDDFFPAAQLHPPGSALALVRRSGDGGVELLNRRLDPRRHVDAREPRAGTEAPDDVVLAVRMIFGTPARLHPRMLGALVAQSLSEAGALVAGEHRRTPGACSADADAGPVKSILVHEPLRRSAYDLNRHLRCCPRPPGSRDRIDEGCHYLRR